jgi:P-type Ca2+ transporter type 2C
MANSMANTTTWQSLDTRTVIEELHTDPERGIDETEAQVRLRTYGPNRLRAEEKISFLRVAAKEIREPMILLLLLVGVLYSVWGELGDAVIIFIVIATVALVEVFTEYRAKNAVAALRRLTAPTAPVLRAGQVRDLPTSELVPGDVIPVRAGERVPADARLIEAFGIAADESSLTGESVPAEKEADRVLSPNTPLGDRQNMLLAGTTIVRGKGRAVIVATGMATELGRIAGLVSEIREPRTPLQQDMRALSRYLARFAIALSLLVPVIGLLVGQPIQEMVLTGLSLAFAMIPEELPIIITMVLGLGALHLSRQHALVKQLRAAETLGSVTVIATDKTGTLTENKMQVVRLYANGATQRLDGVLTDEVRRVLEIGVLSNDVFQNGTADRTSVADDPVDAALLDAAHRAGLDPVAARRRAPLLGEFTFDNRRKMMTTVYGENGTRWIYSKGAPEAILARSTRTLVSGSEQPLDPSTRDAMRAATEQMANEGLRVLAFAYREEPTDGALAQSFGYAEPRRRVPGQDEVERDLVFVGLAGLFDPPRPEAREAVAQTRRAGIRTLMLTGDHPATARLVAREVGVDGGEVITGQQLDALDEAALAETLARVSVYARVAPEHKLRLVRALKKQGAIVAVTGDGVNDAPALKEADIGVAMGETGTDVAREAAALILTDDNFATITAAVAEGRRVFDNLRKGVRYYLACKVALIGSSLLGVLLAAVPFAPIQIIIMELFMDVNASVSFVTERAEPDLMARPPRNPRVPFMNAEMQRSIFAGAAGLFAAVSAAYLWALYQGHPLASAQTLAFVTWLLGHAFLALNMRSERTPLLKLGLLTNRFMLLWLGAVLVTVVLVTTLPPLQQAFKTVTLGGTDWVIAVAFALAGAFWMEVVKWTRTRRVPV